MLQHIPVDDRGTELYYQDVGDGPAVTFVHGFSGNHLTWWQQIPTFSSSYRCLVPDQRRFGLSTDAADGGVSRFPDDLAALLDGLDVDRTALVGHSMGGWTVASFATQYPDRVSALVLSATPGGLLSPERHRSFVEESTPASDVEPLSPAMTHLADSIAALNLDAPDEWAETRPALDALPIDADRITDAGIPTLLVVGAGDEFMPKSAADELATRLDATTVVVGEAAHSIHFEQPEPFNRAVDAFLDENVTR